MKKQKISDKRSHHFLDVFCHFIFKKKGKTEMQLKIIKVK